MIIGTNFKLSSKKYLDNRQQCASLNDLIINKDSILYPQGFEVYCIKEKAWYQNVSEGDTPEWKIRQSGTSEGGASIDDTKISATTTWSSEYIYDMKLELQDLITQTEDYVAEIDDRLLYVEGRLTSIGSFDGSYDSLTNKPEFPSLQGYATHEYVDEVIANIGKIEGTKDYNELINQPINNATIEYMIDERLIVNVDYFEVGKWYIVNTDLNEEYNSATSFSLVYYLNSDSYSIINTFENEDMHSFIYVSSINEKEIKIKYTTVNGETYELIYNKKTNEKTLNLLSSSGNGGNGGFSGDYNDLINKPFGDPIENIIIDIDVDDYREYLGDNVDSEEYVEIYIDSLSDNTSLENIYFEYEGVIYPTYLDGDLLIGSINDGETLLFDVEFGCLWLYSSVIEATQHIIIKRLDFTRLDEKYMPDSAYDYNSLKNAPCYDNRILITSFTSEEADALITSTDVAETFGVIEELLPTINPNKEYVISLNGEEFEPYNIYVDNVNTFEDMPGYSNFPEGHYGIFLITNRESMICIYIVPNAEIGEDDRATPSETSSLIGFWDGMGSRSLKVEGLIEIYEADGELKQLDEKFIPNTIARIADLEHFGFDGNYDDLYNKPNFDVLFSNKTSISSNKFVTILNNKTDATQKQQFTLSMNTNYIYKLRFTTKTGSFIDVPLNKTVDNGSQIKYSGYLYTGENNTLPVIVGIEKTTGYVSSNMTFKRPVSGMNTSYLNHIMDTTANIIILEGIPEINISSHTLMENVEIKKSLSMARSGNTTIGLNSTALGGYNSAEGNYSFAEGIYTIAKGTGSHAEGTYTIATNSYQHVQGKYNIEDTENKYAHIVGNGGTSARSNAHTLDWKGNAWYQGNVSIEGTPTNDNDLTTKKYVDDLVSNVDIDLSDYITDTELEEKGYITEIPSEYITNTELEGKGYITDTDLEEEMVFETDSLTVNSLGGISANTDLNGLTVKEILNKLLFPYIEPVITVTATPNGGTYEKGNNQAITNVSVSITKKSEIITKIEVLNGTQVIVRQNDEAINNGGTFNYNVNVNVPSTNKQLTVKVTDNSGNAITKTTNSFTFVYPYYYGVCDEGTTINGDLIKSLTKSVTSKGTKTVTYTTNNQRMIFAYPKSYGTITKILDPNSFDVTSTFTMSQITIIGLDGTGQSYYVYVNSPSTVSNFNMKFSY